MPEPDHLNQVSERMRREWNERAREDAHFYVAFGRREQDDEEFFETAREIFVSLETELKRLDTSIRPRSRRALEIGCGPGRLMRPLSRHFGEVHGVDVSDEMIERARVNLARIPHAHPHHTTGADLAPFADESFDFVYSYAVFQHIPSQEVVFSYLSEADRVLKPGGVIRVQINGLDQAAAHYDTWSGVRISAIEVARFAREHGLQLLALEGASTQYMWATLRKPVCQPLPGLAPAAIRRITNTHSSEPFAPRTGRYAALSFWIEHLPEEADLNSLEVTIDGAPAELTFLGPPEHDGLQQLNLQLPPLRRAGLLSASLSLQGVLLCPPRAVRIIPPGPAVPVIMGVTDGIDMLSKRIVSGVLKLTIEEADPAASEFQALISGVPCTDVDIFCVDPRPPRYEINCHLPRIQPGVHQLDVSIGRRKLAPVWVEISEG
ncbi:MAG TPA: class I SAM-dependent methyltransferase [Bryobacteraceae bacterium]|nr:class I SAM-dependent methyltransferase [Bryobacteraceae bacterium]